MIKIISLMDNLPSENKSLIAEHGLSFYIEIEELKILFDFGAEKNVVHNALVLGVDLKKANICVCSHAHYDHAGGYKYVVEEGVTAPLITGEGFFFPKYAYINNKYTYLGINFDEEYLLNKNLKHKQCVKPLEISEKCFIFTNFKRTEPLETIPERFVKGSINNPVKDDFEDEVCIVAQSPKGLVVIVGCSHPGIINIITTVQEYFNKPIYAVIGGTHLVEADRERILHTLETMKSLGIKLLGFNHCTGALAREIISNDKEIDSCYLAVGDCLEI